jgi:tetratricopeptide (TPR) repeat protein
MAKRTKQKSSPRPATVKRQASARKPPKVARPLPASQKKTEAQSKSKSAAGPLVEAVAVTQASQPTPESGPPQQAIVLFEQGMSALQRHAYERAAETFSSLIKSYPGERTLLDRVRVYLDLCKRELQRRPTGPQTSEERLTLATLALNNGTDGEAENLAKRVLAEDPHQDLAAYLLAVIAARRGHTQAALDYLRRAVEINPASRAQARHDEDFGVLHDLDAFHELTDVGAQSLQAAKIAKRSRTDQ